MRAARTLTDRCQPSVVRAFALFLLLLSSTSSSAAAAASAASSSTPSTTASAMSYPSIKLTYFDIEGAGEPVRLALTLAGIPFEDDRIKFPDWPAIKPTTPYGQVPLLYVGADGAPKTQSGAMLRYAGKLNAAAKLYPDECMYEVEEAIGLIGDLQKAWTPMIYMGMRPETFGHPEGFSKTDDGQALIKQMRSKFVAEDLPKYLKFLADYIDAHGGGKFLCSAEKPTIADCLAVPTLRAFTRGHIDHVPTDCLGAEPRIVAYLERFVALPEIKGRYQDGIH